MKNKVTYFVAQKKKNQRFYIQIEHEFQTALISISKVKGYDPRIPFI